MNPWLLSAILLGGLIFLFYIYGLLQPKKWEITESIQVDAEPATLFPYLNTIRNWEEWTIWNRENNEKFDFRYEGPEQGAGATQHWTARKRKGATTITGGTFNKQIDFTFAFGQGQHRMHGHLALVPRDGGTKVSWHMRGNAGDSPAGRVMAKMMKPYMQKDLQRGLLRLQGIYGK